MKRLINMEKSTLWTSTNRFILKSIQVLGFVGFVQKKNLQILETMTKQEDEKIRVLNLLVWLQVSLYASDNCENISWFFNQQTKYTARQYDASIRKYHGEAIKELWDVEEVNMQMVMNEINKFAEIVTRIPFYRIGEATQVLTNYFDDEQV